MPGGVPGPVFYLSPHPDDVALSCGGSVAADVAAGARVTLVTVFSAGLPDGRRDEDRAAAAVLGVELATLDLPDALARPEVRGRLDLFTPLRQRHLGVLCEVVSRLQWLVPEGAPVRAPLGVGGHIDHRLTCAAARALREVRPLSLSFYEDLPYSLARYALGRRLGALDARLPAGPVALPERGRPADEVASYHEYLAGTPMGRDLGPPVLRWLMQRLAARAAVGADRTGHSPGRAPCLSPQVRDVSGFAGARFEAIAAYASQWPLFFSSMEALAAGLRRYGTAIAGDARGPEGLYERFWIEEG